LNEGFSVQVFKGDYLSAKGKNIQNIYVDESSASLGDSEDLSSSMLEEVTLLSINIL